ncbi:hypothetical protein KIN20_016213 [Parelaphostrongylus tenuis]|uniref:7TM GPCR serpentine receptor class x (Srx) domain-containing protein n=1 Tax=Parelaphostrongylus tenuis TaxID=148309 RepID=A0AAD5MJN6_PARTN|nr:hypothetical protein KIN20_016213 [Parelaphostrongylus tenuis]
MNKYEYSYHDHFFIFYIVLGSTLLLLNLQAMLVIQRSKCLWILSGYRLIFFGCAADAVNCAVQIVAVVVTLRTPVIHPTTNMFLGALNHGSYSAGCPIILALSVNRLVAVVFPKKMNLMFDRKKTRQILILCWLFGVFTCALCLSGEIRMLWDPCVPKFYYTNESSFVAIFTRTLDLYFGEFVCIASFIIYLTIIVVLLCDRQRIHSVRVELPLLFHSFQVFAISGISLYLWFYSLSDSIHYRHAINSFVIFRFGVAPVSLIITNRTYRRKMFACKHYLLGTTNTVECWAVQPQTNVQGRKKCQSYVTNF